jgi:hypothetical protein
VVRRELVVDDFRVQTLERSGGWQSFTIIWPWPHTRGSGSVPANP